MGYRWGAVVPAALVLFACADETSLAAPELASEMDPSFARVVPIVRLNDACDSATFNAVLGAGACLPGHGTVTFDQFIATLTKKQRVDGWEIRPVVLNVREGANVPVVNTGGEEHTYTEVDEFGGGIVPMLNQLAGFAEVAPECANLNPTDRVPAGHSKVELFDEEGVEKYQCCIHPWMQQIVHIHKEH